MIEFEPVSPEDQPDRNLVVLLVDGSHSMSFSETPGGVTKIDQLRSSLEQFLSKDMHEDAEMPGGINRLETNGEIAIGAFRTISGQHRVDWLPLTDRPVEDGSQFHYVQDVRSLTPAAADALTPNGGTPIGEALIEAMAVIEHRKDSLQGLGLTHECRPNLYMLTDGQATTSIHAAATQLHAQEEALQLLFWAFGTPGCRREELTTLANKGSNCRFLDKKPLGAVLSFLNKSMRHQPGANAEATAQESYDIATELLDDTDMAPK